MNAHSFTLLCVDRQDSGSGGGRVTEAARQQCGYGGRAEVAGAKAAASEQAASSGVAGWQDIGGGGDGRAVATEAVWQWAMAASAQGRWQQHRGGGRAAGRQQQCGGSREVLAAEQQQQSSGKAAERQSSRAEVRQRWHRGNSR
jgi:hypothetical protein